MDSLRQTHQFRHADHNARIDVSKEDMQRTRLGPTTYSPLSASVLNKAPEYSMGTRREPSLDPATDLGPGEYDDHN